jgi:hydroxyquinol 1,2-dioxygenase
MRNFDEDTITHAVLASFSNCEDTRLQTVMTSLVQHLHVFARDVRLTEEEWFKGIEFLTQAGQYHD